MICWNHKWIYSKLVRDVLVSLPFAGFFQFTVIQGTGMEGSGPPPEKFSEASAKGFFEKQDASVD